MTSSDDNKPKRGPRKRRTSKTESDKDKKPKTDSEEIKDAYKEKIRQALQENLDEYLKERNLNKKQISSINSFIEEHLSCFVLLGYTVDGDPVSLVNSPTQKDSDSLGTLLHKFLSKYQDPPGGGPNPFTY